MTYKTTNFHFYILPVVLICATVVAYYNDLNPIVVMVCGLVAFMASLSDHLTIVVDEDKFNIRYSNLFGRLMSTDNVFYFKDIKQFSYKTDQWTAGFIQATIIIFVDLLIPGQVITLRSNPKTTLTIATKNLLGDTKDVEIVLDTKRHDIIKALDIIKSKCKQIR